MEILVLGGTRFFGIHTVNALLKAGHDVTIATRGITPDSFGDVVKRIKFDRNDRISVKKALADKHYDVVIDKTAYCSNDIKYVMDVIDCDRYIYMSSTAVYNPKTNNTKENDFDALSGKLIWCNRPDFPYDEIKRQAEYALWQKYSDKSFLAVRYPFVIGRDDYTKRLYFYVEHIMKSQPMNIDNSDNKMSFINSKEAGEFMAFLADKNISGAINGASDGVIAISVIISYIENKTGKTAIINSNGDNAPYNGETEHSISTEKARSSGYEFSDIYSYIYDLLDYYIAIINNNSLNN